MSQGVRPDVLSALRWGLLCSARSWASSHGMQAWVLGTPCSANLGADLLTHRALAFHAARPIPPC